LVLQESATVISHKIGQSQALDFLKQLKKTTTQELFLTRQLTVKAWRLFYQQTRQDTSFVDCANLAIARELAFDRIFSFDRFYRQFIPRGSNLIS
jgi:predicted nucleic acid-binding protein